MDPSRRLGFEREAELLTYGYCRIYDSKYNCTNIFPSLDLDNNGYLNAYEFQVSIYMLPNRTGDKFWQMNCSLCAPNVKDYYIPWNWTLIHKYADSSYWLY